MFSQYVLDGRGLHSGNALLVVAIADCPLEACTGGDLVEVSEHPVVLNQRSFMLVSALRVTFVQVWG